jgi:hypothetical protein
MTEFTQPEVAAVFLCEVLDPGPFDAVCGVAQDMLRRDDVDVAA